MQIPITILGTSAVLPEVDNDSSSYLYDRRCLIDLGWYAGVNILRHGITPLDLDYVFVTHCHQDHCLGLPQLLFYLRMKQDAYRERKPLTIVGPAGDIVKVMERAKAFLAPMDQEDLWQGVGFDVVELEPGERFKGDTFELFTCPTDHKVKSMCLLFVDNATGKRAVFTGDTGYFEPIAELAQNADFMVHDTAAGVHDGAGHGHSSAMDAAKIAEKAGVGTLALTHCGEHAREAALAAAREIFPNTIFPRAGETLRI